MAGRRTLQKEHGFVIGESAESLSHTHRVGRGFTFKKATCYEPSVVIDSACHIVGAQ